MARTVLIAVLAIAALASRTATAAAPQVDNQTCGSDLQGVRSTSQMLDELRGARAQGKRQRATMLSNASKLAEKIAKLRSRSGASVAEINTLYGTRAKLLSDIETSLSLLPILTAQIDALKIDLEESQHQYKRCLASSTTP